MSLRNQGALVSPIVMTADGVVFTGGRVAVSGVQVVTPGTAGELTVYEGVDTRGDVRLPAIPYTELIPGQVLSFSNELSLFYSMYLTVPTGSTIIVQLALR